MEAKEIAPYTRKTKWRERIHNFSWHWHISVMATGVCSSLLHNFPYQPHNNALKIAALSLFLFDFVFFILLGIWAVARCMISPEDRGLMWTDPATSLFIGFFANGAAQLINAALSVNSDWGTGSKVLLYTLWGLWWLDCALSCFITLGLVHLMIGQKPHDLAEVRPVWMIPIITLVGMSVTGGLFARSLLPHSRIMAVLTISASFTMLAIGLSFTMMLTTAFLLRLYTYGPLNATVVLSTFTTVTPLGQGGYSMLLNGKVAAELFPIAPGSVSPLGGGAVYSFCACGAYMMWSMGLAWIAVSCCSIYTCARDLPRFSITHWCIVVPNAVFAALSLQLGVALDSGFFRVFGAVWTGAALSLWVATFIRTVMAIWDGSAFDKSGLTPAKSVGDGVEDKAGDDRLERADPSPIQVLPPLGSNDAESMAETLCFPEGALPSNDSPV
ncbi:uncharacterized protein PHACADRAFT_257955 [Phanerochaete carnosa HHB-10118-sp]|uniref:C4-dicarboxylate transporter/malic acid transport protein n=1 Tax=Phanerochaete carnosa (strain HHB-10118-sp) TaxID=650164 RepID=K5WUU9_PHACS|nr:uncharacterized protein PHACADRAFT_257955 [Phanerochaete carnosa HHB-10118-sp]EKM54242.1 hypothetical protein PHACADRAFT_257955 [Phanerochaete carnosa HHB-10118-sp]